MPDLATFGTIEGSLSDNVVSADDPAALISCTVDGSDPKADNAGPDYNTVNMIMH